MVTGEVAFFSCQCLGATRPPPQNPFVTADCLAELVYSQSIVRLQLDENGLFRIMIGECDAQRGSMAFLRSQ